MFSSRPRIKALIKFPQVTSANSASVLSFFIEKEPCRIEYFQRILSDARLLRRKLSITIESKTKKKKSSLEKNPKSSS